MSMLSHADVHSAVIIVTAVEAAKKQDAEIGQAGIPVNDGEVSSDSPPQSEVEPVEDPLSPGEQEQNDPGGGSSNADPGNNSDTGSSPLPSPATNADNELPTGLFLNSGGAHKLNLTTIMAPDKCRIRTVDVERCTAYQRSDVAQFVNQRQAGGVNNCCEALNKAQIRFGGDQCRLFSAQTSQQLNCSN